MFSTESKILIADDMMVMRRIVKKSLNQMGFNSVQDSKDGEEAWNRLMEESYDLIISDWNMPKMTGLELLKKVRGHEKYGKIPFILLTAEADEAQVAEAQKEGVDAYIKKPFSPEILKEKLEATHEEVKGRLAG